jgi:hypothetical protein
MGQPLRTSDGGIPLIPFVKRVILPDERQRFAPKLSRRPLDFSSVKDGVVEQMVQRVNPRRYQRFEQIDWPPWDSRPRL